jgi:hypothetical protein
MPRRAKEPPTLKTRLEALWNDSVCRSACGVTVWRGHVAEGYCSRQADDHAGDLFYRKTTRTPRLPKRKRNERPQKA